MEFRYARSKICGWELDRFDEFGKVPLMVGDRKVLLYFKEYQLRKNISKPMYYCTFKNI
jgi:hypothetical protein